MRKSRTPFWGLPHSSLLSLGEESLEESLELRLEVRLEVRLERARVKASKQAATGRIS